MALPDWTELAALAVVRAIPTDGSEVSVSKIVNIIREQCPFRIGVAYKPANEPTLLICVSCRNTESPEGALSRHFNRGRCLHCGGTFMVYRV